MTRKGIKGVYSWDYWPRWKVVRGMWLAGLWYWLQPCLQNWLTCVNVSVQCCKALSGLLSRLPPLCSLGYAEETVESERRRECWWENSVCEQVDWGACKDFGIHLEFNSQRVKDKYSSVDLMGRINLSSWQVRAIFPCSCLPRPVCLTVVEQHVVWFFQGEEVPHRDSLVELMLMDAASAFHLLYVN